MVAPAPPAEPMAPSAAQSPLGNGYVPAAAPSTPPSRSTTVICWLLLSGSLLVVALAATMNVRGRAQVTLPGMTLPLPELCNLRRFTGLECPGCGMTRSFISLAHGDAAAAWRFNPAGPVWFVALLAQIPYRLAQLWFLRRGRYWTVPTSWTMWTWLVLCGLLIGQWFIRMAAHLA